MNKWVGLYPKAHCFYSPIGKDIGEAFEQGHDVRAWLNNLIS